MNTGDQVSDFELKDETGTPRRLSSLLENGPVVLFFYPIASSGGCTQEACHFRDLAAEFAEAGAQRFGISRDDVETQARFRQEHGFDYPLIADPSGDIAKTFGAKRMGPLWSKRQTFVIGTDRRLLGVIRSETDMERHADEALQLLSQRV
jgi:peroxiredoxin Q/BCP